MTKKQDELRILSTERTEKMIGADNEVTRDRDRKTLVYHDGKTRGGFPIGRVSETVQVVEDLAALKALGSVPGKLKDGYRFTLYRPGYGQLTARWDASSTATANDVNVFQATGVATGRFIIDDLRQVPTVAAFDALDSDFLTVGQIITVNSRTSDGDGFKGDFLITDTDYSAEVAVDTQGGIYREVGDLYGVRQGVNLEPESTWFGSSFEGAPYVAQFTGSLIDCEKAFGLTDGMSSANATSVLQSVIDSANSETGKTFVIPAYEYPVGDTLGTLDVSARDTSIVFAKGGSINQVADLSGVKLIKFEGTAIGNMINRFTFEGLFVKNTGGYSGDWIDIELAQYFDLRDIRLVGCNGVGIRQNIHWDSVIERLVILDCGDVSSSSPGHVLGEDADAEYCNNLFFYGYQNENMPYIGLQVGGRSRGNLFIGGKWHGKQSYDTEHPLVSFTGGHQNQFIGCRWLNANQDAISMELSSTSQQPNGNILSGSINNAGSNTSVTGYGVRLKSGGQCRGNIFQIVFGFQSVNVDGDIYIAGGGQRDNNFSGCMHIDDARRYATGSQRPTSEYATQQPPITATDAELNDIGNPINHQIKSQGLQVYNTSIPAYVYATNATIAGAWKKMSDDTTSNTPTGTHDGGNNEAVLTDSGAQFFTDELVGLTLTNSTDGSSGTITANTETTITATLSGGTDDDWDTGDTYTIS